MAKIKKNTFQATVQESHLEKAVILPSSKYALILSKHGIKPVKVWEYDKI